MSARRRAANPALVPPPMTACDCTGRTFADVELRMRRDGLTPVEAEGLTGCGSICTACLPDLRAYLDRTTDPSPKQGME